MSDETRFFAEAFGPSSPEPDQDQAPEKDDAQDQAVQDQESQNQDVISPEPDQDQAPEKTQEPDSGQVGQDDPPAEPGPDQQDKPDQDKDPDPDLDALKKKAHGYDSMLGRLERERDQNRRLSQELEYLRSQASQPETKKDQAPAPQSGPGPIKDIPEDLAEDLNLFTAEFSEYADLIREDGPDGQKLRKGLKKYGPEWASAAAEGVAARREVKAHQQRLEQEKATELQDRQQAEKTARERQAREHLEDLFSEVPEYGQLRNDPKRATELEEYHRNLFGWIEEKPYREAFRFKQVLGWEKGVKGGDARSVAEVLKQFHEETRPKPKEDDPPPRDESRQAAAQAAAVPSRTGSPPPHRPDPNDERAAFREAFGRK